MLLLATFGEGEPTDSAVNFYEWMMSKDRDNDKQLLNGVEYCVIKSMHFIVIIIIIIILIIIIIIVIIIIVIIIIVIVIIVIIVIARCLHWATNNTNITAPLVDESTKE